MSTMMWVMFIAGVFGGVGITLIITALSEGPKP